MTPAIEVTAYLLLIIFALAVALATVAVIMRLLRLAAEIVRDTCMDIIQIYHAGSFSQIDVLTHRDNSQTDVNAKRARLDAWEEYARLAIRDNRMELLQREVSNR